MATVKISVLSSTLGEISRETELTGAIADAFVSWATTAYPDHQDDEGNSVDNTPEQSVQAVIDGLFGGVLANVNRHVKQAAAKAAEEAAEQFEI